MMVRSLLNYMKVHDIQLWSESDKLKWKAPKGLMNDRLKAQMKNHKAELLALLRDKKSDTYHQDCESKSSMEEKHLGDIASEDTNKQLSLNTVILGDCLEELKTIPDSSIDLIATDPPFGIGFMGKAWDTFNSEYINKNVERAERSYSAEKAKKVRAMRGGRKYVSMTSPAVQAGTYDHTQKGNRMFQQFIFEVSKECLRVLKPGAFMFMCMTPRQDSLARAIVGIENAGFKVGFTSMYWTYASGFPKARNISKAIDKKLGVERKKMGRNPNSRENCDKSNTLYESGTVGKTAYHTKPATEEAKKFDGAFAGFQPKPAVEVIIVAMKSCDQKTYTDQALSNGKGVTCLDDCRVPYKSGDRPEAGSRTATFGTQETISGGNGSGGFVADNKGRFPANLLISDDVLDDGKEYKSGDWRRYRHEFKCFIKANNDEQMRWKKITEKPFGYSRFFSLDAWSEFNLQDLPEKVQPNLPFIIVPKASKKEKDIGLDYIKANKVNDGRKKENDTAFQRGSTLRKNTHPTVKPIKLMAYLITMGSRENDIVLDPFAGSGSTCIAAKILNRRYIGIELSPEYHEIAVRRLENVDKDNTIKKSIHEAFKKVKDVEPIKNRNVQAQEKLETHIVCPEDAELRLNVLP